MTTTLATPEEKAAAVAQLAKEQAEPTSKKATPKAPKAKAKSTKKKAAKKKAAPKKTAKAPKPSPATEKAQEAAEKGDKKEPKPKAKKGGLRKPQIRILKFLATAKEPHSRATIGENAPCDVAGCTEWIGSPDDVKRLANDEKMGFKSLITLGFVKGAERTIGEGKKARLVYTITAKGKKAVADLD